MKASTGATSGGSGWLRAWPSLVALAACGGALVVLAFDAGGYYPSAFLPVGAGLFGILGVLLAIRMPHWRVSTEALLALAALGGLAAWTGISATWAPDPSEAVIAFERVLFYTGLFALALVAAGSGRTARAMLWGAIGVLVVVVGAGLLSRLFPDLIDEGYSVTGFQDFRLSYPLTYWNAFGAAASLGAVLTAGLSADPRARPVVRGITCALAALFIVAMYFSLSRGAWLALALGIVGLLVLGAHRGPLLLTLAIAGGAALAAIVRLRGYDALVDDPAAGSGQSSEGRAFAVQLVLLVLAAGALQATLAGMGRTVPVRDALSRLRRMRGVAVAGAVLVAIVVYAAASGQIEGRSADALDDASGWISAQWEDFMAPTAAGVSGTGRLTTARGSRSDLWRVAFDGFENDPLRGDGAGAFETRWTREREVDADSRDAHSLGFETLGELGLPGGLLLLAFLGAIVRAAIRSRIRRGALRRSEAAAAGAAALVWVAHSMVDWDWQIPALTGIAFLVVAPLFPEGRVVRRRRAISSAQPAPVAPAQRWGPGS